MEVTRFEIPACPDEEVAAAAPRARGQRRARAGARAPWPRDPAGARDFLLARERHPPADFRGIERRRADDPRATSQAASGSPSTATTTSTAICSTAVLVRSLRGLGADVDWYLPDRATDGYGLNAETIRRLAARGTRLLVTTDCAITAVEEVALARGLGLDVVVTDHHAPRTDGSLPDAPIVHPAVCGYPCRDLCATAVAHKLAQALWQGASAGGPGGGSPGALSEEAVRILGDDLDVVALATIADVVPLTGENRSARASRAAHAGRARASPACGR